MDEKVIQAGMFNNRSTGSERRELLQSILRADDQEEEEENEAPDDETINQVWNYRNISQVIVYNYCPETEKWLFVKIQ
jgi:hypothetical protein